MWSWPWQKGRPRVTSPPHPHRHSAAASGSSSSVKAERVTWTRIDRDYEQIRINLHSLFHDLGINPAALAA